MTNFEERVMLTLVVMLIFGLLTVRYVVFSIIEKSMVKSKIKSKNKNR